jgi:DNA-directed RNA polymerase specialized sigma24 family protein
VFWRYRHQKDTPPKQRIRALCLSRSGNLIGFVTVAGATLGFTSMPKDVSQEFRAFPETRWSLVARANAEGADNQREAMGELISRYLPALNSHFVLRKKLDPSRVDDLLQGFIVTKVLHGDFLSRADREKGKFRNFLLTAVERYIVDVIRQEGAKKRSPGEGMVLSIDEHPNIVGAADQCGDVFDTAWAREVIAEALRRLQAECEASGRSAFWGVFEARVVAPILDGANPLAYDELVEKFGFQSPTQASNALITVKRMFVRALRSVVSEYAKDEAGVDAEIQELMAILSQAGTQIVRNPAYLTSTT